MPMVGIAVAVRLTRVKGFRGALHTMAALDLKMELDMDETLKDKVLRLLEAHRIMTVATLRPDGWPQATTVGYASDDLSVYFLCGKDSQKAANLARDDRVSATIDHDTGQVMEITGLSMAARAQRVTDPREGERVLRLLMGKYPEQHPPMPMAMPKPEDVAIFRLVPEVISVLDYTKGFGHTDLVTCQDAGGDAGSTGAG